MSNTFLLPDLGEGLTEADIVRWLVAEGDTVAVDQPMVEVETAKALVEVPSPYAGTVLTLHGAEGETMDVGSPLITIGEAGESGEGSAPRRRHRGPGRPAGHRCGRGRGRAPRRAELPRGGDGRRPAEAGQGSRRRRRRRRLR
ncbi:hypothetical protein GY12_04325 [Micrococcus luteus]|nr:hypothetical protein GY12_04325 [Micrococcus luteus]